MHLFIVARYTCSIELALRIKVGLIKNGLSSARIRLPFCVITVVLIFALGDLFESRKGYKARMLRDRLGICVNVLNQNQTRHQC